MGQGQGFRRGRSNPCIYYHEEYSIRLLVHGDDFMGVASRESAHWVKERLKERFTVEVEIGGHREGESREIKILNRIVRATPEGWEYEADQRHGEILVKELGVEGCAGVGSPGEEEKKHEQRVSGNGGKIELPSSG